MKLNETIALRQRIEDEIWIISDEYCTSCRSRRDLQEFCEQKSASLSARLIKKDDCSEQSCCGHSKESKPSQARHKRPVVAKPSFDMQLYSVTMDKTSLTAPFKSSGIDEESFPFIFWLVFLLYFWIVTFRYTFWTQHDVSARKQRKTL